MNNLITCLCRGAARSPNFDRSHKTFQSIFVRSLAMLQQFSPKPGLNGALRWDVKVRRKHEADNLAVSGAFAPVIPGVVPEAFNLL